MKRRLLLSLFVVIASMSLAVLVSCDKPSKEVKVKKNTHHNKKVGIALAVTTNPFDKAEKKSLAKSAKKNGFKAIFKDAKGKLGNQHANIESLIAQKVSYLVVVPIKENGFKGIFYTAHEAKLPIILINRGIYGVAGRDFTALITTDGVWEGQAAAEWLLKNIEGKINVVQLVGTPGASVTKARTKGFRGVAKKNRRLNLLESKVCDFSRTEAFDKTKELIEIYTQTNVKVDAIFAQNDSMALGAIEALQEEGFKPGKDVLILGVDGQKEAKEAIERGEMAATISSSPYYGPIVFKNIKDLEEGKKIEPVQTLKGKVYDKSNISELTTAF
jgi:galactofuranose transport system substrate-binding protein